LVRGTPNPDGAKNAQLYLLVGDPTVAQIREIVPEPGLSLPKPRTDLAQQHFRLGVLHFNDLHGNISRVKPHGSSPVFSRMVGRLRSLRQRSESDPYAALLVMSAGDELIGSAFDELLGDDADSFTVHTGYHLYSAGGVDIALLGNHDLDTGTRLLAHAIRRDARFPLLSANLVGSSQLAGLYYPAALLVLKGVRVGIVGLTTPAQIKHRDEVEFRITNPIGVAHNLLPTLRPLCDVLILLTHLGRSLVGHTATVLDAGDVELAESLPYGSVNLIVGGHTHEALNEQGLVATNIVNGIPIVQAGMLGRFLGEVSITMRLSGAAVTSARLSPVADLPVDEDFEREEVQPLIKKVRPLFSRELGHVADDPDLSTEAVRNDFAASELALVNFISDALVARCEVRGYDVDFAMIDSSSLRCGLPVGGSLTFGDWFNLMPFADSICLCHMTGRQLKAFLTDNAFRVDRPSEPHTERGFAQFSRQIRYTLEMGSSRDEAQASQILADSIPLDDQLERSFLVACSSFFRAAAISWERYATRQLDLPLVNPREWPRTDTNLFLRDEMIDYIREHGGVTAEAGARRDGRLEIVQNISQFNRRNSIDVNHAQT
jgi:2',3'-cyclic-nucleotide 2'-phosphodiesterase (5'-nucleotidase family)